MSLIDYSPTALLPPMRQLTVRAYKPETRLACVEAPTHQRGLLVIQCTTG